MKILFYAWNIYDEGLPELQVSPNGGSIAIRDIIEHIGRKCEVYLFVGKKKLPGKKLKHINIVDTEKYPDYEDDTLDKDECWLRTMTNAFESCLMEIRPDFVNLHGDGVLLKRAILKCKEAGIKYAYTNHLYVGGARDIGVSDRVKKWEEEIFQIPELMVTTVSTSAKDRILQGYPHISADNIHVILNGTEMKYEPEDDSIIEKHCLYGKKVLLCVGNIIKRKNQLQIVRAFAALPKEERENIVVLFCGKDGMEGALQREIEKYELQDQLIYVGVVPNSEMKKYYSAADGYILISLAEGLSLTMLEAMVYGLPLIMFDDVEGASDLRDDKVTILIHGKEDEDVAQAIREWKEKEYDMKYIQEYAKYFSLERVADDYISYYRERIAK